MRDMMETKHLLDEDMMRTSTRTRGTSSKKRQGPVFVGKFLVTDPAICHGQLTFRGTRVPVQTLLLYLAKGYYIEYLRRSWPEVSSEAILEAMELATELLSREYRGRRS